MTIKMINSTVRETLISKFGFQLQVSWTDRIPLISNFKTNTGMNFSGILILYKKNLFGKLLFALEDPGNCSGKVSNDNR